MPTTFKKNVKNYLFLMWQFCSNYITAVYFIWHRQIVKITKFKSEVQGWEVAGRSAAYGPWTNPLPTAHTQVRRKKRWKISDIGPTPKIARIPKIARSRTSVKLPFFSFLFDSVTPYLSTTSATHFVGKNSHFIVFLEFALFWSFQSKTNE